MSRGALTASPARRCACNADRRHRSRNRTSPCAPRSPSRSTAPRQICPIPVRAANPPRRPGRHAVSNPRLRPITRADPGLGADHRGAPARGGRKYSGRKSGQISYLGTLFISARTGSMSVPPGVFRAAWISHSVTIRGHCPPRARTLRLHLCTIPSLSSRSALCHIFP